MACPTTENFHISTTNEEIVALCQDAKFSLGGESGHHVTRIAQNAVTKWGLNVTLDEANIQDYVQRYADARTLKVPEVFRYFQTWDGYRQHGYLVMEYVEGKHINEVAQNEMLPMLISAIKHLWAIPVPPNLPPGPFSGGKPRGYMWSDNGSPRSFHTLAEMQAFINWCIGFSDSTRKLALNETPLMICHTDLVARNILSLADGTICILDWGFAGIYPQSFEIYSLVAQSTQEPHCGAVLQELGYSNASETPEIQLLDHVYTRLTCYLIVRLFITLEHAFTYVS